MWTYNHNTPTFSDQELKHYGVLGMKWGVRRYQNKDGTLTPAGKKRYNRDVKVKLDKKDVKWIKKNEDKIFKEQAKSQNVRAVYKKINWDKAEVSKEYGAKINSILARELNKKLGDLKPPSKREIEWVANNSGMIGDIKLKLKTN